MSANSPIVHTSVMEDFIVTVQSFLKILVYGVYYICESIYHLFVPVPPKSLDDEIILITGSASGIGREICHLLSETKAVLVLWDLNERENKKLADKLKKQHGTTVYTYKVDISNTEQVIQTSEKVMVEVGNPTMIFNNAGITKADTLWEMDVGIMEKQCQVNLTSHMVIIRQFLPKMLAAKKGHIVATCSVAGLVAIPFAGPYVASKHGVNGLMDALRMELTYLGHEDIVVSTVYPTFVDTTLLTGMRMKVRPGMAIPILDAVNVAEAIVDGVRRNKEFIYIPYMGIKIILMSILPSKLRKLIQANAITELGTPDGKMYKSSL